MDISLSLDGCDRLSHDNGKIQKLVDRNQTEASGFLWLTFGEEFYVYTMQIRFLNSH